MDRITHRILIVEDEAALAGALATACRRLGHEATTCASGAQALAALERDPFALLVLDIGLPDMNGLDLIEQAKPTPVLVITAHGNLENAVAAKRLGAGGYLVKPLDLAEFQEAVQQLVHAPATPTATKEESGTLLIGASPAMQKVFVQIAQACVNDAPVLITGPTGSGKTLAARAIHANSPRQNAPFVVVHCGALPETLLESELFGHEKHAFTGAQTTKTGHIERARGGTLFLDEIGDISPAVQAKLLRFVEEKTFSRIGGREDIRVDLRLLTATNKDLRTSGFREDLFYRLHVLEVEMPALRDRREDIPALSAYFLAGVKGNAKCRLSADAMEVLMRRTWPGNLRELRNVLERASSVCSGNVISRKHLPKEVSGENDEEQFRRALEGWIENRLAKGANYRELSQEIEGVVIKHLLSRYDHRPTVMAREMKMNRATLLKKRRHFVSH